MVSTQQIGNLGNELSTASGLPKAIAEQIIQKSLSEPSWVIPFNTSTFPLYTQGSASGIPVLSSTQTCVSITGSGTGAINSYTVTSGKSFALHNIQCGAGYTLTVYKNDGTTIVAKHQSGATVGNMTTSYAPLWVYSSGEVVKINMSGTETYILSGVEY